MPRIAREDFTTLYFHIMVQGINKEFIFEKEKFKEKYKRLLSENLRESKVKLLSYCIMDNHVHMLSYTKNPKEMSKLMQKINTSYAIYYNKVNNRVGVVFRNRFTTQPINSRRQLYNCLIYIHNNPVKAGIVKNPNDYKYSSYGEWITGKQIIDEQCAQLVYNEELKDIKKFKEMHLRNEISDIDDIEEYIDYKKIIEKYKIKEDDTLEKIVKREDYLNDIVRELRQKSNMSIRRISEILNINRPKVTKILKEVEKIKTNQ